MTFCTNCGSQIAPGDRFCPKCGATVQREAAAPVPPVAPVPSYAPATSLSAVAGQPEDKGRRVLAFLIDIVPLLVLAAIVSMLPFIRHIALRSLGALYWLLRDVNGASPGKIVMGSLVVQANGAPATTGQRIGRNITLALPALIATVPFVGVIVAAPVGLLVFVTEVVLLLVNGRRLGDMLAGTTVVRR